MLKRGLQIFFTLFLLTAIVLAYFYFSESTRKVVSIETLFADESVFFRINEPGELLDQLNAADYYERDDSSVFSIHSMLYLLDKELKDVKYKTPYLIYALGNDGYLPILAIENYTYSHSEELLEKLKSLYSGFKVYEKESDQYVYYGVYDGDKCLLCLMNSDGNTFITNSNESIAYINKKLLDGTGKVDLPHFYGTANENAVVNLYVNGEKLHKQFLSGISGTNIFNNLVLDLYFKQKQLVISGLGSPGAKEIMQQIAKSIPVEFKLPGVIPDQVNWMLHSSDLEGHRGKSIGEAIGSDKSLSWIKQWFSGDVALFKQSDNLVFALNTNGPSVARRSLLEYAKKDTKNAELIKYKFDNQTSFNIISSDFSSIAKLNPFITNVISGLKYGVVAGQFVVFSSSLKAVKEVCGKNILKQNLRNTYQFKQDELHLSSASNFIMRGELTKPNMEHMFGSDFVDLLFQYPGLKDLSNYTVQLGGSSGLIYTNIVLSGNANSLAPKISNWKSKLEKSAILKPVVVRNHINNQDEIFVQDEESLIYLLNSKGRILWQKKLDGPILGDVYQVDRYKNNKLQYLFNTAGKIYLIDRNGNHVEDYPVELSSKATAGLALFDYEKRRDYRMFIPLENRMVNLYDIDGKLNPGWEFNKTDAIVTEPVQHFRYRSKDYIVFADTIRFYFVNRRGHERIVPSEMVGRAKNSKFWFDKHKSKWITTSPEGKIVSISLSGKVETEELVKCGENHYFMFEDLTSNGWEDYIFVDGKKMFVFDHKSKKRFDYNFDNQIEIPPAFYIFSRDVSGVGVVDKIAGKVYLFNRGGKQLKGFPYPGVTPFTIAGLRGYKGFQLLVGNLDGYLYDYQLP